MKHKTMNCKWNHYKWVLFLVPFYLLIAIPLPAQNPSWAQKATSAVFTLKTFDSKGTLLSSSNGFFIGEQGEALSCFTPFKGAHHAVIIDAQGKEWPVDCMLGANEMYDVAKFQVTMKKPTILSLASSAADGAKVWLLPYTVKKAPNCLLGTIASSEKFQNDYSYYTLQLKTSEQNVGCPILNDNGEVLGLLQPSAHATDSKGYAVSASFAQALRISGLSMNDPALQATAIAKAVPDKQDEALLALFMAASTMTPEQYEAFIQRFIQQYPNIADGYIYRARLHTTKGDYTAADNDMQQALKMGDKQDDTHYQYAQMIFQKELFHADQPFSDWTLDRALAESQAAWQQNPQPVYRQQQAQILFAQQKYAEAYAIYEELSKGPLRSAETFYAAAQCKLQQGEKKAALMLLDSTVNQFTRPYIKTAAPYLIARAELSMEIRRYQQAINDMQDVVALEPTNAELWAQKASYELRVNLFDQALESAQECLRLDPQGSDGYLMSGIALCAKGQKTDGLQNLNKAKELGNSQAQTFIDKYSN